MLLGEGLALDFVGPRRMALLAGAALRSLWLAWQSRPGSATGQAVAPCGRNRREPADPACTVLAAVIASTSEAAMPFLEVARLDLRRSAADSPGLTDAGNNLMNCLRAAGRPSGCVRPHRANTADLRRRDRLPGS